MLEEEGLVGSAKSCTLFGDLVFCKVDELFECLLNTVVSFGSGLLECVVGVDEGVGVAGS